MNKVVLVGRITKDPELRKTPSGASVVNFSVAVNRTFANANGEREADFINCVVWGRPAENMATYVSKGSLIGIDGRIQTRNYEDANQNRVYVTEVVAENVQFLESKSASNTNNRTSQPEVTSQPKTETNFFDDLSSNNNSNDVLSGLDISDDDLPF